MKTQVLFLINLLLFCNTVLAAPDVSKMYWVDSSQNAVLRANLDGTDSEVIVDELSAPFGISIDPVHEYIFWSDNITNSIYRANLEGQNVLTIITGLVTPNHLAVDTIHEKIYWSDRGTGKVQRANLNGSNVENIITGLASPRGVGVDAVSGYLYCVDTAGTIYRSSLEGTGLIPLLSNLDYPFCMTLDLVHGKIFWAEISYDKIRGANLDGSDIYDLVTTGLSAVTGIDVDTIGNKLYFTDFHYDRISRCNPDGSDFETILEVGALPNDIALYIVPEPSPIAVVVDIKPGSCPNPVNVRSNAVLHVAILGTNEFDVTQVDPASIRLAGVEPFRSAYKDVAAPVSDTNECACTTAGRDGFPDLTLKFKTKDIVTAIGDFNDGEVLILGLTGVLYDSTPIEGEDCIVIHGSRKIPQKKPNIKK